jgi:rRNA processing protein Gar1
VGRPYVVVRTGRGVDAAKHVGKKLYFDDSSWRDRKWKR